MFPNLALEADESESSSDDAVISLSGMLPFAMPTAGEGQPGGYTIINMKNEITAKYMNSKRLVYTFSTVSGALLIRSLTGYMNLVVTLRWLQCT